MGLLDRFRAQPRWKNASPAIRAAAVEELPLDQQDTLISIAREDRDPGVRIAALRKVIDPAVVASIGRADADEGVREEAVTLLVDLASGAFEGTDQAESLAALNGLSEAKQFVSVARTATNEAVARAALDRLVDEAALAAVARKAAMPSVRLDALRRLIAPAELTNVALRTEFKDVALAAVERLSARDLLCQVADHAKNKTAAKRARALLRAIDAEAEATGVKTAVPVVDPAVEAEKRRLRTGTALCEELEALATAGLDEGEATLAEIDRSWAGLEQVDSALTARFEAARTAAQGALSLHLAERAERARIRQANAEAIAARRSLCEQVDAIAGEETPARIDEARTEWAALPVLSDAAEADRCTKRFEESCRAALARHHSLVQQRATREKAGRLCQEAERLADGASFPQARTEAQALRRAWHQLTAAGFDDPALIARFDAADARLRDREMAAREHRELALQENHVRLQALCTELEGLAKTEELSLKQAEHALREARAALDDSAPLPTRQDRDAIDDRLKAVLSALFPKVQELRDMDEWQRWANAGIQEELCERVEKLMQVDDLAAAAKQLRDVQAQWKQVAIAPRDQSQALWARFKAGSDAARARCDVYFTKLAEEQASNRARKISLCEQVEALSSSTDWIKTANAIKALQAEWKTIGGAPRALERALWERFHAACDAFFTRRREDMQHRKEEWAANLARKEALCQQAEAIADTTEWQEGIEQIKRLQAEWKTVGPVRKTRAEEIWQRFRIACDKFFEAYQQREHGAVSSAIAEAEAVCQELESLLPAAGADAPAAPEALGETVTDLRKRWSLKIAGLPRERAIRMGDRFMHALARLTEAWPASFAGTDIDPETNARRMEELCLQVERLLASDQGAGAPAELADDESPATLLARQLREALATNTIAGRQDETAKWKAVSEQIRSAQAAWKKIGPVPESMSRTLNARFQRACTRVAEKIDQQRRGLVTR
ncbi:MAG TPA: DUF349 domain-containing protein [Vicinamibacterales bacterium]